MIDYVYIAVRTDIPLEQQLVQACHAALESGFSFDRPDSTCHLVLCSVPDEAKLLILADKLASRNIDHEMFHEPWWNMGYSALATKPIKKCNVFSKLPLWKKLDTKDIV